MKTLYHPIEHDKNLLRQFRHLFEEFSRNRVFNLSAGDVVPLTVGERERNESPRNIILAIGRNICDNVYDTYIIFLNDNISTWTIPKDEVSNKVTKYDYLFEKKNKRVFYIN